MGLAVLGSATHLLPAVGPGDSTAHRRQRAVLGRWATARLIVANGGVAGLAIGLPLHLAAVATGGAILLALGLGSTAVLMAGAIRLGLGRAGRMSGPDSGPSPRSQLNAD